MYRENNTVGIRQTPYHAYCELTQKRMKRSRNDINDDIFNTNRQIAVLKRIIEHPELIPNTTFEGSSVPELKKELSKTVHKLEKLQSELHEKDHGNTQHKRLKTHPKKQNLDKLEQSITNLILDLKEKGITRIEKESVAYYLKARVSQVEVVFMRLNQKGILSQPEHHALHDSQRDPWGFFGSSDWCSDNYYIR